MDDPIKKRLTDKHGALPKWAEDFSIETSKETNVSRRDFIRFLGLVSFGLFMGTSGVYVKSLLEKDKKDVFVEQKIAGLNDIAVGESTSLMIPGKREPVIMVRLSESHYVAYGQKCTHLQCPVLWNKEEKKLLCPCYKGAFAVEDGRVLYRPPKRPLPQLELVVKHDGVYCTGVKNGQLV